MDQVTQIDSETTTFVYPAPTPKPKRALGEDAIGAGWVETDPDAPLTERDYYYRYETESKRGIMSTTVHASVLGKTTRDLRKGIPGFQLGDDWTVVRRSVVRRLPGNALYSAPLTLP